MGNNLSPKQCAQICCDTIMRKFKAEDLPPQGRFHYHQGVLLSGFERTFKTTENAEYKKYLKAWADSLIDADGNVTNYRDYELDGMMAGVILFDLYEETGDERYKKVLDTFVEKIKNWKLTPQGGFWHMLHHTDQMWLDGFYMGSPLLVRYGARFGDESLFDIAHTQLMLMRDNMRDPETGLFYHAWDVSKQAPWANPETGLSAEFWGRAIGWYVVAAVDIASYLPESYEKRQDFIDVAVDLIKSLAKFQDEETGLWYQVVNKGHLHDNWLETSCSALYTYATSKAIRMGWLDASYKKYADNGFKGCSEAVEISPTGNMSVPRICIGTCLGDYKFYINRPTEINMLIGVGAFLLMCNEYNELLENN